MLGSSGYTKKRACKKETREGKHPSRVSFVHYFQAPATQGSSYLCDGNRDDHGNDDHRYADVGSPRLLSMVLAFMLQY